MREDTACRHCQSVVCNEFVVIRKPLITCTRMPDAMSRSGRPSWRRGSSIAPSVRSADSGFRTCAVHSSKCTSSATTSRHSGARGSYCMASRCGFHNIQLKERSNMMISMNNIRKLR